MAEHPVKSPQPIPISYARRARNGTLVQAALYTEIAEATNHITAYRKKWLARFSNATTPNSAVGTISSWRAYIRTGHHCKRIVGDLVLASPNNAGATDPYVDFQLLNVSTGASIVASGSYHYGPIDAGANGAPGERQHCQIVIDSDWGFSDDTAYWLQLYLYDYARVTSASFWELGSTTGVVDDTITGAVDPRFAVGGPITDAQRLAIAAAQTEIIRTNRQQMFSWSVYDDTAVTHLGTTMTNMLNNSSTTVSAASPGFYLNNLYRNTYSRTTVPVVFAVYAKSSGLAGTLSTIRLTDGTNTIDVGPITSEGWYTNTGSITAAAATKFDIHGNSDNAVRTAHLWAATLLEYE